GANPVNKVDPLGMQSTPPGVPPPSPKPGCHTVYIASLGGETYCGALNGSFPTAISISFGDGGESFGGAFDSGGGGARATSPQPSFEPHEIQKERVCAPYQALMRRPDIQEALKNALDRSARTGFEEGFLYRLTAGSGSRFVDVAGRDRLSFPVYVERSDRDNYAIFHVHTYNGGFSAADASQVRQGYRAIFTMTPSDGFVVNCRN
ncbi:hypothetical protein, partial [Brevundimonas sp. LPMIX5]